VGGGGVGGVGGGLFENTPASFGGAAKANPKQAYRQLTRRIQPSGAGFCEKAPSTPSRVFVSGLARHTALRKPRGRGEMKLEGKN